MVKIAEKQISTSSLKTSPFWKSVVSAFKWIALIILIGILLQRIRKLPDVATLTSTTATTEMTMVNAGTANSPAATFPVAAATATFTSSTTQGTTSHGRDASYSSIDISSHGIPPVVPTRTGDSSTTMHPPPSPLTSSSSPPAPVPNKTATKGFNLGLLNMTYPQYLQHKPSNGTKEDWDEWYNSTLSRNRPNRIIIKLFAIHKDEWPLIKNWVYYHGEMLGFEHLYILDGSLEENSIYFLRHVKETFGVNVIFTEANLNGLAHEITKTIDSVRGDADLILKVDPDEFLAVRNAEKDQCRYKEASIDDDHDDSLYACPISPYNVEPFLQDPAQLALLRASQGQRMKVQWIFQSASHRQLCEAGRGDDIGELRFQVKPDPWGPGKTLADIRTVNGCDIGGHNCGTFLPDVPIGRDTPVGILHVHYRCLEREIQNNRKALIGHKYINPTDTDEEVKATMHKYVGPDICAINVTRDMAIHAFPSVHKVLFYARAVAGCYDMTPAGFYPKLEKDLYKINGDFDKYLKDVMEKYDKGSIP